MNIENNFYNAKKCLKVAQANIKSQDYESALIMLAEAYAQTRMLLEYVFKLQASNVEVSSPSGKDSGGS